MNRKQRLLQILLCLLIVALSSGMLAQDASLTAYEMRWSPDGRWIGVGSSDGIWIFDVDAIDAEPYHYAEGSAVYVVEFDPVRPYVAFAPSDAAQVSVIEIATGTEVFRADTPPDDASFSSVFYDLGYSDDGQFLSVLNTSLLYVLDAATGDRIREHMNPAQGEDYAGLNWLTSLDYNADTGDVLVSDWNATLLGYGLDSGSSLPAHTLDINDEGGYQLARFETIPGTDSIMLLGWGGLYTYDRAAETLTPLSDQAEQRIDGFDLSSDGTQVAVGAGTSWYLYDLDTAIKTNEFTSDFSDRAFQNRIYSLAFSPDADRVATLQTDGQLNIWDIATGEVVTQLGIFGVGVSQKWG